MLFRNAKLGSVYQVRETLYVGLPHIRSEYQMHKLAMTYDFDQSTIGQFVCMMRERSRANLVPPEKASQRHRVPVSSYLPQNSNPSRLGQGARDSSKLMICQLFDYPLPKQGPVKVQCATILWPARLLSPACIPLVIFAQTTRAFMHLAEQPRESVLCLKLRYWIEFSGILFHRQSIES